MSWSYEEGVAAAMREALRLYDEHPEIGIFAASYGGLTMFFNGDTAKADQTAARRALALGSWTKEYSENFMTLRATTAAGVKVQLLADRDQVCEEVVTGKKTVEEESMVCPECEGKVIPDGEGGMVCAVNGRKDYYARPLKKLVKLVEVDKTEWVCNPAVEASKVAAVTA